MRRRAIRLAGTLVVTGLCAAYIFWKIDVGRTAHILVHASLGYFLGAVAIMVVSVWPMAWRWQQLLAAKGIRDRLSWLVRAYFVAYTGGQVLPTAVGGDAVRIYETSRRHPGLYQHHRHRPLRGRGKGSPMPPHPATGVGAGGETYAQYEQCGQDAGSKHGRSAPSLRNAPGRASSSVGLNVGVSHSHRTVLKENCAPLRPPNSATSSGLSRSKASTMATAATRSASRPAT